MDSQEFEQNPKNRLEIRFRFERIRARPRFLRAAPRRPTDGRWVARFEGPSSNTVSDRSRFARSSSGLAMMWSFGACKGDRRATSERASLITPVFHVRSTDSAVCDPIDGSFSASRLEIGPGLVGLDGSPGNGRHARLEREPAGTWAKSGSSRRCHPWPGGGGRRTMYRRVWSVREEV